MKKRVSLRMIIALALLSAVALYGYISLSSVSGLVQFVYPAPALVEKTDQDGTTTTDNSGLAVASQAAQTMLEGLPTTTGKSAFYAVCDPATLEAGDEEDRQSAVCRLEAQEDGIYAVRPLTLYVGRLIYPDEFKTGEKVILLDEGLAIALFKYAEPIDREVTLQGVSYRVVGIVRSGKQVGDHQEYRCYLPLRSLDKVELPMTALCVDTLPAKGSGAYAALKQAVPSLSAEGTLISLSKEKMNAAMPLRVLIFAVGCAIAFFAIRWLSGIANRRYREYKEKIKVKYFIRLMPWALWNVLLLLVGFALCAGALAYLFVLIIDPVYTFPEWVPAVLVEPKDIAAAFWNVWQTPAAIIEYRTPELLRVRFFGVLIAWVAGGLALLVGALLIKIRPVKRVKEAQDEGTETGTLGGAASQNPPPKG